MRSDATQEHPASIRLGGLSLKAASGALVPGTAMALRRDPSHAVARAFDTTAPSPANLPEEEPP